MHSPIQESSKEPPQAAAPASHYKEKITMAHKGNNVKTKEKKRPHRSLRIIRANAAGIDLGSREHWVCGPQKEDGTPNVERFGTTTPELFRLADWLKEQGVK